MSEKYDVFRPNREVSDSFKLRPDGYADFVEYHFKHLSPDEPTVEVTRVHVPGIRRAEVDKAVAVDVDQMAKSSGEAFVKKGSNYLSETFDIIVDGTSIDVMVAPAVAQAAEIEALMKEHETTLANIAKYEDILNNYDSMAQVIIDDLDALKKEYAVKRKTKIENAEEAVFEENKVQEQEVVLLMDRFGYAKTVDGSVYERNREAADKENKYILRCMNTGKLCLFTSDGKMHQIKVMDLPYGKFRDKGFPIDNVSNFDSTKEEIVYLCDDRELFFSKFLFVTKQGMIKKVAGSEFQVTKRTIAATKLQDEDALVSIRPIRDAQDVVLMTENGFVLRFPAEEVSEKKKGAVGVRGMKLQKNDSVEEVYLFEEGTESKVIFHEKEVTLNRLKRAKRDGTGTRMRK
mgnify:CR=1 FL=1